MSETVTVEQAATIDFDLFFGANAGKNCNDLAMSHARVMRMAVAVLSKSKSELVESIRGADVGALPDLHEFFADQITCCEQSIELLSSSIARLIFAEAVVELQSAHVEPIESKRPAGRGRQPESRRVRKAGKRLSKQASRAVQRCLREGCRWRNLRHLGFAST